MLRFSLFGFPVTVHWMFWVTCVLIGGGFGATTQREILLLVMFVAAAFVSILLHELGHAFMMRRYGSKVSIMLYAFGGMASGTGWYGRFQGILVSLAGPVVQIVAGLLILGLLRSSTNDPFLVSAFLRSFVMVSIFWGVFNLLPIYPMDGGQVMWNVLGPNRAKITFGLSAVLAAGLALLLMTTSNFIGVLLLGMMAYENVKRFRGEQPDSLLNPIR